MARKGKGSDDKNQLTFVFDADSKGVESATSEILKGLEKAAKAADKLNETLEKTGETLKNVSKLADASVKVAKKSADDKAKAEAKAAKEKERADAKAAKEAERAAEKEYKAKIKFIRQVRTEGNKIHKELANEEKKRLRESEKAQKDYINDLKKNLADLKQQQKDLQKHGYGAIVNAFTEGFPARLGTALSYKTIGVGLETIRDSFSSITELQQQFAAIYAITDSTSAAMEKLRDTIFDVGNSSSYATEELANATIILGQAGLNAEQIVNALEAVNNLAIGTGTDLSMSVNVLTSSLAVWNKEASQAGHVADVLVKAANETKADVGTMANAIQYAGAAASDLGVSFEEFAAVASAVTNAGLKARSVVGTGFRSVLTELINPTAKLKKVFAQLGVSLEDVDVRSRGLTNVLQTLKDAGLDAAMAFQGFDRRAASFFVAATSQLDMVNKLRTAFLEEGAAEKAAERQMDTLSSQMTRLTNTMKQAFSDAFRPLVGILTELVKLLAWFTSTGLGQFITKFTALFLVIKGGASAVFGLIKAYKELKLITTAVITATLNLATAQKTKLAASMAGSLNFFHRMKLGLIALKAAFVGTTAATKALGVALKMLAGPIIAALLIGIEAVYSHWKSQETLLNEADDRLKESESKVNSLTEAYNELVQKQKLYGSDQDALIARGKELNKQFELQGVLVLRATDSLQQYLTKLQLVINSEKEKQLIDKQKVKEELVEEVWKKGEGDLEWGIVESVTGTNREAIRNAFREKAYKGDYVGITSLQQDFYDKIKGYKDVPGWQPLAKRTLDTYITKTIELAQVVEDIERLTSEIKAGPETAEEVSKLSISLGNFTEEFKDRLSSALNVETFEEMTERLAEVKDAIVKDTESREKDLQEKITEAKQNKNMSGANAYTSLLNQTRIESASLLQKVDTEWKNALGKRATKAATDYQNFAKAIEKGQSGMPPDKASEHLEELRKRVETAINAQKDYELSILKEAEDKRIREKRNKIQRLKEGKESVPTYFTDKGGTLEQYIAEQERQIKEGVAKYKTAVNDIEAWAKSKYAEAISRANAADLKNQSRVGTPFSSLFPYTSALYQNSDAMKALEQKYRNRLNFGERGVLLYGQELFGDEKNRRFMDDAWAETALKGIQTFTDGFSDAVTQFANSAKTFKEAMRDFASSSLQTIGNWLIQMSIKAMAAMAIKSMFPEFFGVQTYSQPIGPTMSANNGFYGMSTGGPVVGGVANRDSVNTRLMPGEYVLKKSTVDYLGENFLNALNANASQTLGAVSGDIVAGDGGPASVVNVWVVADEEEAGMGPNDVIATITKDIRNGGQTRQLIKSIVAGRK